jgi:co-chaperonin GroES (HSP10)
MTEVTKVAVLDEVSIDNDSHSFVCPVCGVENVKYNKREGLRFRPKNTLLDSTSYGVPFRCSTCRAIQFNVKAVRDIVFLWPIPLSKTFVEGGLIVRTDKSIDAKDEMYGRSEYGIVLSVGKGYYDNKKFHPTCELKIGSKVIYDSKVPWCMDSLGFDGKMHTVIYCGIRDIQAVVDEKNE